MKERLLKLIKSPLLWFLSLWVFPILFIKHQMELVEFDGNIKILISVSMILFGLLFFLIESRPWLLKMLVFSFLILPFLVGFKSRLVTSIPPSENFQSCSVCGYFSAEKTFRQTHCYNCQSNFRNWELEEGVNDELLALLQKTYFSSCGEGNYSECIYCYTSPEGFRKDPKWELEIYSHEIQDYEKEVDSINFELLKQEITRIDYFTDSGE